MKSIKAITLFTLLIFISLISTGQIVINTVDNADADSTVRSEINNANNILLGNPQSGYEKGNGNNLILFGFPAGHHKTSGIDTIFLTRLSFNCNDLRRYLDYLKTETMYHDSIGIVDTTLVNLSEYKITGFTDHFFTGFESGFKLIIGPDNRFITLNDDLVIDKNSAYPYMGFIYGSYYDDPFNKYEMPFGIYQVPGNFFVEIGIQLLNAWVNK